MQKNIAGDTVSDTMDFLKKNAEELLAEAKNSLIPKLENKYVWTERSISDVNAVIDGLRLLEAVKIGEDFGEEVAHQLKRALGLKRVISVALLKATAQRRDHGPAN